MSSTFLNAGPDAHPAIASAATSSPRLIPFPNTFLTMITVTPCCGESTLRWDPTGPSRLSPPELLLALGEKRFDAFAEVLGFEAGVGFFAFGAGEGPRLPEAPRAFLLP